MNIHKLHRRTNLFFKKITNQVTDREIEFYHRKKLKFKMIIAILRESLYIIKGANLNVKSAQITYTFIVAIVPFLSILFTFVHFLHGFENIFTETISPIIRKHFGFQVGSQISDYLQTIIKNIQVKELGVISFITFSITVIFLLLSIEDTFNSIMRIENKMSTFQRFLKCWIIITVSPFLLALAAVNSDPLLHLVRDNSPLFLEHSLVKSLRVILSMIFQALYFVFIYYVMPSKRLNFKAVLVGGAVASILLEILQYVNIFLAKSSMSTDPSKIYGTVPLIAVLFFAWIRLGWIVTLAGAACSLASQKILYFHKDDSFIDFPAKDLIQCVSIYCSITRVFKDSGFPVPANRIVTITKIPLEDCMKWIYFLCKKGVIFSSKNQKFECYSPSYKSLQSESNAENFLKEILFSHDSKLIHNYNDIEKYFILCLKGEAV